jgi:mono/diheme cytochrome c family protein
LSLHRVRAGCNSVALAVFAFCARSSAQPAARIDFQREIRPILSDNCFLCHGPDADSRMAGLRLDRPETALGARPHGAPVVPGNSAASLLYQRISNPDPNLRMPPAASRRSLTPAQIALLKRWIDQGAPWKEQWSFQPPVKPKPPALKDAASVNPAWLRNPIDRFILARLEEKGLAPAPPADARTLIRRVALSVTGLPPKPSEVEAFLADAAPGAYERMVDRYLASPHYGEQRAHYWLDAVRYADTNGIHFDNYREIWPYRDWVIAAFNRNQPFNQFAIDQIAGDLEPNATLDQRIATGFQRSNVTTNEAGIIEDEYTEIYAKDRADTFGSVFLGLTVGCATCHDHKFDPISQKDYYSLGAFFRNTPQKVMDGNTSDQPPFVIVPRQEDRARWDQIAARQAAIIQEMSHARAAATGLGLNGKTPFETWLRTRDPGSPTALFDEKEALFTADLAHLTAPGGDLKPGADGYPALYFANTGGASVATPPKLDAEKPFTIAISFLSPKGDTPKGDSYNLASHQNSKDKNRGWVLDVSARLASFRLIGDSGENIEIRSAMDKIEPATWNSIVVTYDGSRAQSGLDLYLNGRALVTQGRNNPNTKLQGSIGVDDPLILGKSLVDGAIAGFRIIGRVVTEAESGAAPLVRARPPGRAVAEDAPAPAANPNETLFAYFLLREFEPYRTLAAEQNKLNLEAKEIFRHAATTPVMMERTDQKPFAHILYRGAYDQPRERVEASTPAVLPPMAAALPRNRLGLAKWLFTDDQPLTARVAVNRMWQEIFGVGLVRTADDFGSQGEPPSHPQLLDWLAVDFQQSGWDIKRFYRQILTSAAYRQMALATPQKLAQDPENRLLSRGLRFRMDAEMLRDYALAASGLLAPQIGGPSVKPYQPEGIWESIAMLGSNTRFYKQDSGNGLYRRSIYTLWKRSAPPASMEILNAPTREGCTVRRERTDTPLQALVTMNDVQFVEAARTLAGAAMENGLTFAERLSYLSSRILIRPLTPDEQRIARKAYDDFERYYSAHPDDARKFLDDGERKGDPGLPAATDAALTMLASQLLNLDEVLNQ